MTNQKYEITDIAHEEYPFLHRIRALRDIGEKVKAGDLGGFVESESNLSFEPGDDAWILTTRLPARTAMWIKAPVCGTGLLSAGMRMCPTALKCPATPEPRTTLIFGEPL